MNSDTKRVAGLIAAAAVIVGSLMPWATVRTVFGSLSVSGTDGDGVLTLIGGGVAGIFALIRRHLVATITFGIVGAIAIYDVVNVSGAISDVDTSLADASVGWGLWLVVVSAVVGVILSLIRTEPANQSPAGLLAMAPGAPLPPPRPYDRRG